jgi:hypothetical protein
MPSAGGRVRDACAVLEPAAAPCCLWVSAGACAGAGGGGAGEAGPGGAPAVSKFQHEGRPPFIHADPRSAWLRAALISQRPCSWALQRGQSCLISALGIVLSAQRIKASFTSFLAFSNY